MQNKIDTLETKINHLFEETKELLKLQEDKALLELEKGYDNLTEEQVKAMQAKTTRINTFLNTNFDLEEISTFIEMLDPLEYTELRHVALI